MHLTQHTNYALRVLMYLAVSERPARIADIARHHAISHNHLVKIVHRLALAGYVITKQGRGGGVELSRPAAHITVGEIVRLTEENMHLVECFSGAESFCKLVPICRLRKCFTRALDAFLQEFDQTTIADISSNRNQIRTALAMDIQ